MGGMVLGRTGMPEGAVTDVWRRIRPATSVILHRLSTTAQADQILVLVERGSHAELMQLGGRYRAMLESQSTKERGEGIPTRSRC
jgi:ABC-type multidrug transport system fused ATPase/permease subunit